MISCIMGFNILPMLSSLFLMDILSYNIFSRTWSFMSLLLFSTQLGVVTWFWGRCLLHLEFSLSSFNHLSFPLVGQQTLFHQLFQFWFPPIFLINKRIIHYIYFFLIVKNIKNKIFRKNNNNLFKFGILHTPPLRG